MDSIYAAPTNASELNNYLFTAIIRGDGLMFGKLLEISPFSGYMSGEIDSIFFNYLEIALNEKSGKTFIFQLLFFWNKYRLKAEENESEKFPVGKSYGSKVKQLIANIDMDVDLSEIKPNEYAGPDVDPNEAYKKKMKKYYERKNSDNYNFGRLILKAEMTDELLMKLIETIELSFEIAIKLVYMVKVDDEITDGLMKVSRTYGPQPTKVYKELMKFVFPKADKAGIKDLLIKMAEGENVEVENYDQTMYDFLVAEIQKNSVFADIPKWIIDQNVSYEDVEKYEYEKDDFGCSFIPMPRAKEAAKLIVESFDQHWLGDRKKLLAKDAQKELTEENMEASITTAYETATNDIFRYAMMPDDVLEKLFYSKDEDLQAKRILGLSNPFNYEPAKGENSRMFICNTYLREDVWGIKDVDWFTGNCDYCNKRIRHYYLAVRKPVITGGWIGCYCKWKHVRKSERMPLTDLIEPFSPITIVDRMILYFENEIQKVGVYKRDYPPEAVETKIITVDEAMDDPDDDDKKRDAMQIIQFEYLEEALSQYEALNPKKKKLE